MALNAQKLNYKVGGGQGMIFLFQEHRNVTDVFTVALKYCVMSPELCDHRRSALNSQNTYVTFKRWILEVVESNRRIYC